MTKWGNDLELSQSTIKKYYKACSIKDYPKNPIASPAKAKQEKLRSLCIRASIDFTPIIKQLRKQFRDGKISKDDVMKSLYDDFEKWKTEYEFGSMKELTSIWKSICKKINLQTVKQKDVNSRLIQLLENNSLQGVSEREKVWQQTAPDIEQIVNSFKENYKHGKYTAEAANYLIENSINIWAHDNYYTQKTADEIYELLKIK